MRGVTGWEPTGKDREDKARWGRVSLMDVIVSVVQSFWYPSV